MAEAFVDCSPDAKVVQGIVLPSAYVGLSLGFCVFCAEKKIYRKTYYLTLCTQKSMIIFVLEKYRNVLTPKKKSATKVLQTRTSARKALNGVVWGRY